ncbi:MAG: VWA domain-containing protein [bacterium]|nr:VWA domain-containing protein [bacterium]
MSQTKQMLTGFLLGILAMVVGDSTAQSIYSSLRPFAANIVVPQARSFAADRQSAVEVTVVTVGAVIMEQAATTTMDISVRNPSARRIEAELAVPVPDGAVVRSFTFEGAAKEPTTEVLAKNEATRTYEAIVAKVRDPAMLEFIGYNLIRSSVFPIEARGTQKVRLTYEHLLFADGDRIDYILPRTESLDYRVPWNVSVRIKSKRPISTVYSPSHEIEMTRLDLRSMHDADIPATNVVSVRLAGGATTEPGPFRLSYILERNGVTATLFSYPDPKAGGGYFLLLGGLPAKPSDGSGGPAIKREVILVLDRSGSMSGEKIEQVREAARQVVAGLEEGEAFNIIAYNEAVEFFAKQPVMRTEETVRAAQAYLKSITARGGTNIHDALLEALRQKPAEGMLPIVLFLTDGLPTVGQTSEVTIRNVAMKANAYERRIFTFGVGVDVNTPLLERIALETRATATFVLPKEDVEVKVSQVFNRLSGPILASPKLEIASARQRTDSGISVARVRDVIPDRLPDLFEGDQLVVLGKYIGEEPLTFELSGNYLGRERTFRFTFDLDNATTRNAFVPRLWASRKIGMLVDAIRQLGADVGPLPTQRSVSGDPRLKELVDEIVSLSTEFGILTEYTAFLAREGTDLTRRDEVLAEANRNFHERAIYTRSGLGAVNQGFNSDFQRRQQVLNYRNNFFDANMNRVAIAQVQQINDMAFYRRGNRWVDSRVVEKENEVKPRREVVFGSEEFRMLAQRLASENRQGAISFNGDVLLVVDGEPILVKGTVAK